MRHSENLTDNPKQQLPKRAKRKDEFLFLKTIKRMAYMEIV